jgi:hypothetical protein
MTTIPATVSPAPSRSAVPRRRSGPTDYGGARLVRRHEDVLEILERARVSTAAHHVLGAAELDDPAAHLGVPLADRVGDPLNRNAVRPQAKRIHVDLVLFLEPAHRRDFGHAGDRLELVPEMPVLIGTKLFETVFSRAVDEGVLVDPAETRGIGPQLGLHAFWKSGHRR